MSDELKKSEILFLYETTYNIPNGDPFTGEQRYDEETKKILVSDVRMKRFVRDYLISKEGVNIYLQQKTDNNNEQEESTSEGETDSENKKASGSARRIDELIDLFKTDIENVKKQADNGDGDNNNNSKKKKTKSTFNEALFVMKKCIDVRIFGGISTKKNNTVQLTGPVQFALLNNSLNSVDLRPHQNTSCFESKQGNKQGAIGTTTLVPYSLIQIHGWVNPKIAETTEMISDDLKLMYEGLWYGTSGDGSSHSRSKIGQNSVLLLEIVYNKPNQKIYGVDRLISIKPKEEGKKSEQFRSMDDYDFNFDKLIEIAGTDKVAKIKYYTELQSIKDKLSGEKFELINLCEEKSDDKKIG
ncbi:MAG: CRISPR-associated protein [Prevotella sp.]